MTTEQPASTYRESNRQPIWHVVVLNVLSFFAYSFIWMYKNWHALSKRAKAPETDSEFQQAASADETKALKLAKRIHPIVITLALLVQTLQAVPFLLIFKAAAELADDQNSFKHKHPWITAIALLALLTACLKMSALPGAFRLLYLTAALPLAIAQFWLNSYWSRVESKDLVLRQAFSTSELLLLILGIALSGLVMVNLFFGVH